MKVLAFDFGASSGRAILGEFDGKKIELKEIHRFLNEPVEINGALYWDILRLYHELKQGILKADRLGGADSMGIDTWGVDIGFIGKDGQLLANPFHYRSPHTEHAVEELESKMSREELFAEAGLAFQKFNTLCQLVVMQKNGNVALENAESALFIPDLFTYFLTGKKICEFSIASTSQLIVPGKNQFSEKIFQTFGLKNIFPEIVSPGKIVGDVKEDVKNELDLQHDLKVIATCGHDTASAYLAVPKDSENSVFLSSGTWSLLGMELDEPILSKEAMDAGYTNEGGLNNSIRFLKNIMGLWIIQECKRTWDKEGNVMSFAEIADGASKIEPCKFLINPDADEFYSPHDMPDKIVKFCKKMGGNVPSNPFEIARCVYDSLALAYKHNVLALEKITGKKVDVLHIVGGGSNNTMLNVATANALGIRVTAGPGEGTALGNILCQLIALGKVKDAKEAREIVKNSTEIKEFLPSDCAVYENAYKLFLTIL